MSCPPSFSKKLTFESSKGVLVDFLSEQTSISKQWAKKILLRGGVWLKRGKSSLKRVRKAKHPLQKGDLLEVYHSSKIEDLDLKKLCYPVKEFGDWGVWYKGVNVLSQGTKYGDQNALNRFLEKEKNKPVHLINRLDKEASGLMVFAYSQKKAKQLSKIWSHERTIKTYQAVTKGDLKKKFPKGHGAIKNSLEGKKCLTEVSVVRSCKEYSLALASIKTGRLHQIRRHFEKIGHPLLGDPKYGRGNKNKEGLMLQSSFLVLPKMRGDDVIEGDLRFEVPKEKQLFEVFKQNKKKKAKEL
tara:strand:- start:2124 stop:3020 length:897 start_codon:yes stop_codon:yes gene_type:complete